MKDHAPTKKSSMAVKITLIPFEEDVVISGQLPGKLLPSSFNAHHTEK